MFPVADKVDAPEREKPFEYPEGYEPIGKEDKYIYDLWKEHSAEGYKDAPIALQLVARK